MRVLFLDSVHSALEEALTERGAECVHELSAPYGDVIRRIGDYNGLVVRSRLPIDAELLRAGRQLQFVARSGSGLENIDTAEAEALGISVYSSPEGNCTAVGEHAVGMLLTLLRHLKRADSEVRRGVWEREGNRGTELGGLTVGIIGYGHTGRAFAQCLSGFSPRILAFDKYTSGFAEGGVVETSLSQIKEECDVISVHLPLSPETHRYVDADFISSVSNPFILINTARGNHVDTEALAAGLESGKVTGACLDVLEYEKKSLEGLLPGEMPEALRYITASDRTLLTPHIAGWTRASYYKLSAVLAKKIIAGHF